MGGIGAFVLCLDWQIDKVRLYWAVRIQTKQTTSTSRLSLAKGQLWKTKDTHVQIVELGKMLVHYRMLRDLRQMRRTQMSRIESMEEYLKTNNASLVEDVSRN